MKQLLAYKYRIYPTEDQQVLLSKTFGCKRVIFNHYLNEQQERFKNKEKHLSNYDINKDITKLKDTKEWLREVDSIALQMAAVVPASARQVASATQGRARAPIPLASDPPCFHMKTFYMNTFQKSLYLLS